MVTIGDPLSVSFVGRNSFTVSSHLQVSIAFWKLDIVFKDVPAWWSHKSSPPKLELSLSCVYFSIEESFQDPGSIAVGSKYVCCIDVFGLTQLEIVPRHDLRLLDTRRSKPCIPKESRLQPFLLSEATVVTSEQGSWQNSWSDIQWVIYLTSRIHRYRKPLNVYFPHFMNHGIIGCKNQSL